MRYFTSFLAAAAIVQAATPVARQASPSAAVRTALELIISDAGAVQSAVQGLSSADQVASVRAAISKLQNDIDSSASQFASLSPISNDDALGLADIVGPLQSSTSNAVDAVISQKQTIVSLCNGPYAYTTFQGLVSSASTLATNLGNLFSPTYKAIVQGAADNVQGSLSRGVQAFSDSQTLPAGCENGGGTTPPGNGGTTTNPPGNQPTGKCYRRRHRNRGL